MTDPTPLNEGRTGPSGEDPQATRPEPPSRPGRAAVDAGGAPFHFNPVPANSPHDRAALERYLAAWEERMRAEAEAETD